MTKKNDKRLCWNCEGNVSHHINQCPYCGVDVTQPPQRDETQIFKGFSTPFQQNAQQEIPRPPYSANQMTVSEEEWNSTMEEPQNHLGEDSKRENIALLLLLPGIVFLLFGLTLLFFSRGGVMVLKWNQDLAYFYFLGAIPLLLLGWRAFRK